MSIAHDFPDLASPSREDLSDGELIELVSIEPDVLLDGFMVRTVGAVTFDQLAAVEILERRLLARIGDWA